MSTPEPEPYWHRIRRLRADAGLSQPELFRRAENIGFDTIRALERPYEDHRGGKKSRSRYPSAETLEAVADALGIEPATFPEYRLAQARQLLNERTHGLEEALRCLEAFDRAREQIEEERTRQAIEAELPPATRRPKRATGRDSQTPPANGGPAS